MVVNVHERRLPVPADEVGRLLDRLGGPEDPLWPTPTWVRMVLDGPVAVGAAGGHGPIRYRVTCHEPGRRVEFTFDPGVGLVGTHTCSVRPTSPTTSVLRHVIDAETSGRMRGLWPLVVRPLHDAVVEDLLDRAEAAVGTGPDRPARWSPWVVALRALSAPRARASVVPATRLLDAALTRVDWSDAHEVACPPGMPADPQAWADAVFHDPPGWVVALLALRQALVPLVGIPRDDGSAFDTLAREPDEVLLGTDDKHLDFRVSVLRTPDRVVVSTVVQLHGRLGRAYFSLVRPVHPFVVRAMLSRAALRLATRARLESLQPEPTVLPR